MALSVLFRFGERKARDIDRSRLLSGQIVRYSIGIRIFQRPVQGGTSALLF